MLRILIDPLAFSIHAFQKGENPYIHALSTNNTIARSQHDALKKTFKNIACFRIEKTEDFQYLSDMVFVANGGLYLPRLPYPIVLLPNMKYEHRKKELPYLREVYRQLHIRTIEFPTADPFEGQAELKWFHNGTKAVCGYGYRSTLQSCKVVQTFLQNLYTSFGLEPPTILMLPLASDKFYHLDLAILEFQETDCIVHKKAFSPKHFAKLQNFLGKEHVHVIDTEDCFCLNSVIDGNNLITHKLSDPKVQPILESLTKKRIMQTDVSEFELSGGSVRCMTMDIPMPPAESA